MIGTMIGGLFFNACIESLDLRELELSGCHFTWANSLETPTFEMLDRVLVSTDWEHKFPLVTVQALTRDISDHTPLMLDSGTPGFRGNQLSFQFELCWLIRDGFYELVADVWNSENRGTNSLQRWQYKIRRTRQFLRGWAKHIKGKNKKEKRLSHLWSTFLDKKAEDYVLAPHEHDLLRYMKDRISHLLREEEIAWFQR
jgi:hypothetical protein